MNTKLWKFQSVPPDYFRGSQYELQVFSLSQSDQINIITSQSQPEIGSIGLTPSLNTDISQLKSRHFLHPGMLQADNIDLEYEFCSYPNLTPIPDTLKSVLNGETPSQPQSIVKQGLQEDSKIEAETQSQFPQVDYESASITQNKICYKSNDDTDDLVLDQNSPMFTELSETEEFEFKSKINLHYSDSDDDQQSKVVVEHRISQSFTVKSNLDMENDENDDIYVQNNNIEEIQSFKDIEIETDQIDASQPIFNDDHEEPTQYVGSQNPALTFIDLDEEDRILLDITTRNLEFSKLKSDGNDLNSGSNAPSASLSSNNRINSSGKEKQSCKENVDAHSNLQFNSPGQNPVDKSTEASSVIESLEAILCSRVVSSTKGAPNFHLLEVMPSSNSNSEIINNAGVNHSPSRLGTVFDKVHTDNENLKACSKLKITSSITEDRSYSRNLENLQRHTNSHDDQFNTNTIIEAKEHPITIELNRNPGEKIEVICSSQHSIAADVQMEHNLCSSPKVCKEMDISADTIICSSQDVLRKEEIKNPTVLQPEFISEVTVGNFFIPLPIGAKEMNIINVDKAVYSTDTEEIKLQTPVKPSFSLSYSPDLMAVSPNSRKFNISDCSESSSEPDNSDDENYMPTQMVAEDYGDPLPEEIGNKNKRKRLDDIPMKKLYWKKVKNSEYYQAQLSKVKKHPKGLPDYIVPGQKYISKTSDSPVNVEKLLNNNMVVVKDDQNQLDKLRISDILYSKKRLQLPPKIAISNISFRDYGFLLSLSNQDQSQDLYMNKEYVHKTIIKQQGSVYDSISSIYNGHIRKKNASTEILLLSAKPMRTRKFLLALAAGIPIISVLWIKKCIEKQKIIDYEPFRLSNGESLLLEQFVASKPSSNGVFDQKRAYILCETSAKTDLSEILLAAGAVLIQKFSGLESGDLVVCDSQPALGKKDREKLKVLEIVSVEYIIQCLIHQDLLDSNEHFRFNSW